jgi:DNA-binding helix-hairpin-helix protein with protein kinase domain
VLADEAHQPLSASSSGHDPHLDFRKPEGRVVSGDEDITVQGQFTAAAQRIAVDRGNQRFPELGNRLPEAIQPELVHPHRRLLHHQLEVGSSGKCLAVSGHDHRPHIRILVQRVQVFGELLAQ